MYHSQAVFRALTASRHEFKRFSLCPQLKHGLKLSLLQGVSSIAGGSGTHYTAMCGQGSLNCDVKLSLWMAVFFVSRSAEKAGDLLRKPVLRRSADLLSSQSEGKHEWETLSLGMSQHHKE